MKIKENYHAHTPLCVHADCDPEACVLKAIEQGYKEYSFSDHAPFKHFSQYGIRMNYDQLDGYVKMIRDLKEKYKDQIIIHVGLEIEYSPLYKDYYRELLTEHGIDYLILGQHCFIEEDGPHWMRENHYDDLKRYTDNICEGLDTGYFIYCAHPDFVLNRFTDKHDPVVLKAIERIIRKSIELNLPIEINLQGMMHKFPKRGVEDEAYYDNTYYPYTQVFEMVAKLGGKTIIGEDIHHFDEFEHNHRNFAFYLIRHYHLKNVQHINIEKEIKKHGKLK